MPTPASTEAQDAGTALTDTNYQFAIDTNAPPTYVSGELSADEVTQEGKALVENIPPWTTPVHSLAKGEHIIVPIANSGSQTITASEDGQVVTLTVEAYGRKNPVALTRTASGSYEYLHTDNSNTNSYRLETPSTGALRLTLIFSYQVTVTVGGGSGSSSTRSCNDFEVYLTGTPER